MALTAANILSRAAMIIQDPSHIRWALPEMVNYLNDSRREIAGAKPDVYTAVKADFACASGSRQTLPVGALRLIDVPRNANGVAISVTKRGWLDQQNPTWQTQAGQTTVRHFSVDERDPTTFWVYPPASTATLEIIYLKTPTDFGVTGPDSSGAYTSTGGESNDGTLTTQESLYGGAMVDYICYRSYLKDAEYAGSTERAIAHFNQFATALGISHKNDLLNSANINNVGGVPSKQLAAGG